MAGGWAGDVSDPAGRLLTRDAPSGPLRLPGPASLRRDCLVTLIALIFQFALGTVVNLFVQVPAADAHAGFIAEIRTAPLALTLHAVLGTFLVCAAFAVLTAATRARDRLMIACTVTGLVAIIGAFAAGELFVRNGQNGVSLSMALLTCVALVCYASAVARAAAPTATNRGLFRRRLFSRRSATRTRPGQRTSRRRRRSRAGATRSPPVARPRPWPRRRAGRARA